jgi:parallel beta-helix repeat protein
VRISDNTVHGGGASDTGIRLIHCTRSSVTGNKVFGVKNGIVVQQASACMVRDNQVEAAGTAYHFGGSHGQNVWRGNQCVGPAAPATPFETRDARETDFVEALDGDAAKPGAKP